MSEKKYYEGYDLEERTMNYAKDVRILSRNYQEQS
jgi:hypothetical protein